jgi:DNA polymerase-3 subunit alpha
MDEYRDLAKKQGAVRIGDILTGVSGEGAEKRFRDEQYVTIAGIVSAYKTKTTRNNTLMAYITLGDDSGDIELLVFARALDRDGAYIAENNPVVVRGKISVRDDKDPQILADSIRPISDLAGGAPAENHAAPRGGTTQKKLYVRLERADDPAYARIKLILNMFPGEEQMVLYLKDEDKRLSTRCVIHPALVAELGEMLGAENVIVK